MLSVILLFLFILITNVATISMNIVLMALILMMVIYRFEWVFKPTLLWYILSLIITSLTFFFYPLPFVTYISHGYISLAIFIVIMFTGVFSKKWTLTKRLLKYRGTLSIIGFILILPHALLHLLGIYENIQLFGIVAFALMLPLTIVSFQVIRKEIKSRDWINIQKMAYIIYVALYLHVLFVSEWHDKLVYIVLLTLYLNHKILKEFFK